jgi:hypothetical protein
MKSLHFIVWSVLLSHALSWGDVHQSSDQKKSPFGFDAAVLVAARTLPLAALPSAQGGYSLGFWDRRDPEKPGSLWKYGYLRPMVTLQSIGVTNRAFAEVELFPVSLLGFSAGSGLQHRTGFSRQFECKLEDCGGVIRRNFVRTQMVGGAGKWVFVYRLRYDWVSLSSSNPRPMLEENATILGAPGGDQMVTQTPLLFYQAHQDFQFGLQMIQSRFVQSGTLSTTLFGFAAIPRGNLLWILGAGTFQASTIPTGPTAILALQWTAQKQAGLLPWSQ